MWNMLEAGWMTEEWRPVVGYDGIYSVSSEGRVRRDLSRTCGKSGKILKTPLRDGYPSVQLCREGKRKSVNVHQLVAESFIGPPPEGECVNHKDLNRGNPRLENLEYGTQSYNVSHAYENGARDCKGEGNGRSKLKSSDVAEIKIIIAKGGLTLKAIGAMFGVGERIIGHIKAGSRWGHI